MSQKALDLVQVLYVTALREIRNNLPPNSSPLLIKAEGHAHTSYLRGVITVTEKQVCAICGSKPIHLPIWYETSWEYIQKIIESSPIEETAIPDVASMLEEANIAFFKDPPKQPQPNMQNIMGSAMQAVDDRRPITENPYQGLEARIWETTYVHCFYKRKYE